MKNPKLFISYSWTDQQHAQWVLDLATNLRQSGVDVILDKWDLKEGHDAFKFMEKMVSDPEVNKVLMICNKSYSEKADKRAGGVGTETQIISKEVYENQSQDKFVSVIKERDENGKPYVPIYYRSRIYIDFSNTELFNESFEQLLRWIFDKPLNVKPELGNMPSYLIDENPVKLGTEALFNRCADAIRNQKSNARGVFEEYCVTFADNLERFRIIKSEGEFDDAVIKSIQDFIPYRNQFVQIIVLVVQYSPKRDFIEIIHRFFERLLPYMSNPPDVYQWNEADFDNFKFIIHELFLYTLAVFLKRDRLEETNYFFAQNYYWPGTMARENNTSMVTFELFCRDTPALDYRNRRLKANRTSLRADLLKERCNLTEISFNSCMQADFVAFLYSELHKNSGSLFYWWPYTLLFTGHYPQSFEIFARSISKQYFDRVKYLLGIKDKTELESLLLEYQKGSRRLPTYNYTSLSVVPLLGFAHLETRL